MLSGPVLAAASFAIGLLIGATSMGGAALMTPFLVLALGVRPVLAVGTDLCFAFLTKVCGAWVHWRQGTVDVTTALRLAMGSVPGVLAGAAFVSRLRGWGIDADRALRPAIAAALMLVAVVLVARTFWNGSLPLTRHLAGHARPATIAWGGAVGSLVGLTSVGSGTLVAPFLLVLFSRHPARVVGTDVFHAAVLGGAGRCSTRRRATWTGGCCRCCSPGRCPGCWWAAISPRGCRRAFCGWPWGRCCWPWEGGCCDTLAVQGSPCVIRP